MQRQLSIAFMTAVVLVLASGCASNNGQAPTSATTPRSGTPGTPVMPEPSAEAAAAQGLKSPAACPMYVELVDIAVSDTDRGVAITFTTGTQEVKELRRRVRALAALYERQSGQVLDWYALGHRLGPEDRPEARAGIQPGEWAGQDREPMPRATATVDDVDQGARIVLTPADESRRQALRQHIRMQRERFTIRQCPVMSEPAAPQPQQ